MQYNRIENPLSGNVNSLIVYFVHEYKATNRDPANMFSGNDVKPQATGRIFVRGFPEDFGGKFVELE